MNEMDIFMLLLASKKIDKDEKTYASPEEATRSDSSYPVYVFNSEEEYETCIAFRSIN